jgi:Fur family transcriptional regulator, ferric uptake regulator
VSEREVEYPPRRPGTATLTADADKHALEVRDLSSAIALMRGRGLRLSAARRLVIEALLAADGPMSAEQIAEGIGGRVPSSDIASVYRNLQAFEDIGLVRHVHLGHGPGLHALAVAGEREYLTCERCADYRPVAAAELDGVRELIERQFGYRASFTHFPIVGLCPGCAVAVDGRAPRSAKA